jgi:hypothetical protein
MSGLPTKVSMTRVVGSCQQKQDRHYLGVPFFWLCWVSKSECLKGNYVKIPEIALSYYLCSGDKFL